MRAGIYYGPHDIRVEEVPNPKLLEATDALLRITLTCICGSDLWSFRGISPAEKGKHTGHELMGVVEAVGDAVTKVKVGDVVVAPFDWADGTCPVCLTGMTSACWHGGIWGSQDTDGGQGQMTRVPYADANLFVIPEDKRDPARYPAVLALSDVMCTGHHAAVSAEVGKDTTVAVIGDGAVGLCAVLASHRLGAKQLLLLSTHADRSAIGKKFGAQIIAARGDSAGKQIKEMTDGLGVDVVLECVGTELSWKTAFELVRPGGKIGYVGVPHGVALDITKMFRENIGVVGGVAPAGHYIPELLPDVLSGKLDPSPIFTMRLPLAQLQKGYEAMDTRQAIKVLIDPWA